MSRKISILFTALVVVLGITLVTVFGIKLQNPPATILVEEVMIVKEKGGEEDKKQTRNLIGFESGLESLEVYYFVAPSNATDKDVSVTYDDGNLETKVYCLAKDGIATIYFCGETIEQFRLTITSSSRTSRYVTKNFYKKSSI